MTIAALLFAVFASDVTVVTTEATFKADSVKLDSHSLTVTRGSTPESIDVTKLIELRFSGSMDTTHKTEVTLINGNRLIGTVQSSTGDTLSLATAHGTLKIGLETIDRVVIKELKPPADRSKGDVVHLISGDEDTGTLSSFGSKGITFHSSLLNKDVEYTYEEVAALYLKPTRTFRPPEGKLRARVVLSDGACLHGQIRGLDAERLRLASDLAGDVNASVSALRSIELQNENVAYLSDLEPTRVDERPYVQGAAVIKFRKDRAVGGGPLTLDRVRYAKGLGVHSYCELQFDLNQKYKTFLATVGLDDTCEDKGSVEFIVLGDGRELYRSGRVVGKKIKSNNDSVGPQDVRVSTSGVKTLAIRVTFGGDDDVLDRAGWANARLVR